MSHRSSTSRLSRSPLKKVKIMQCKVTLLDGSDYTLDVEVRERSSWFVSTGENLSSSGMDCDREGSEVLKLGKFQPESLRKELHTDFCPTYY